MRTLHRALSLFELWSPRLKMERTAASLLGLLDDNDAVTIMRAIAEETVKMFSVFFFTSSTPSTFYSL